MSAQSLAPPRGRSPRGSRDVLWCRVPHGHGGSGNVTTGTSQHLRAGFAQALRLGLFWLPELPWGLERSVWKVVPLTEGLAVAFGKLPLDNCHLQVMYQAQEVKAPGRAAGGAAEGRTCLKIIPEKLGFACFAFKQHSHIHAGERVGKGPPLPWESRASSSSCSEEELGTHWLKPKGFPWL